MAEVKVVYTRSEDRTYEIKYSLNVSNKPSKDIIVTTIKDLMQTRSGIYDLIQLLKEERLESKTDLRASTRTLMNTLKSMERIRDPEKERFDFEARALNCLDHEL